MGFNLDRRTNNQAKQVGSFDLDRLGKSDKSRFKSDFKQAVKIGKDGKRRSEQEEERRKSLNSKITETVENNRGKLAADIFNENNSNLKENKSKNETVIQKYGINPETFSTNDLNKWAQEHNFTVMANSSGIYYTPKYEGGLFGIGGRKKTTDTEDKDFKVLEQLAANNTRKRLSNTDMGAFASAAFGMADGATFGVIGALGDKKQKRAYEKAGLPNENFVSFSQARKATSDKHPIADIAGNVGGSLLGFHLAEGLIGAGLSTIPKYTNLAEKAAKGISSAQKTKNLIDTAATVGLTTAGTSAANQEWKKSNWYKSVGNMAIDTAVSSLGAVMGGKFASVVGEKFANTLYKSTKLKPEVIKALTSSAGALSFAGTATGISEMKNAAYCAANNTKYTPNIQDIATNMIVLSLFSGLKTYASEKFGTTSTPKIEEPFEFFTEKEMKSPELLKNKMREYTKKYHPDKFYAMGEDAVKKATDRMSAINAEYERAKARCALNILSDVRKNESNTKSNDKAERQRTHKNATDAIILLNEIYAPENNSVDFVKPRAQSVIAASEQSTKIPEIAIKGSDTPKIVPLAQVGDFYEAYGNEAVELADKLNLTPTYKTVNGEKVQMVGFPTSSLNDYQRKLDSDYKLSIDNNTAEKQNIEQNQNAAEADYNSQEKSYNSDVKATDYSNINTSAAITAADETLLPNAKQGVISALKRRKGTQDMSVFIDNVRELYRNTGSIGKLGQFFSDGGKRLEAVLESEINTADNAENSVEETATPETVNTSQDNDVVDTDIYNTDETDTSSPENMYENLKKLGLTYDEQHAILEYKSSGSYMFNSKLRDGKQLTAEQLKQKEQFNSAIDKFPKYSGIAYRNIGFATQDEFDDFVSEHSGEHLITYPAFTSASKDINGYTVKAPYSVHYEIECINGSDVSQMGIKSEQEVLFKADTTFDFAIVKNTGNSIFIKMKEVSENGKSGFDGILEEQGKQPKIQKHSSGIKNSGITEEVSGASDIIRGRSSAYDEVYNGPSERNGGRIGSGSRTQDLGGNAEAWNDGERKGPLSGIESDKHIIKEENSANNSELHGITPSVRGGGVEDVGVFENAPGSDSGRNEASRGKDNGRNEREAGIVGEPEGLNVRTLNVDTEKITSTKGVNKIISSINKGEDISLESVKNAVSYLINSESDIKTELSALKNSDLQKLLNPIDRSRRTKKADMVDGVYSNMLEEMYYAVTGSDTISYIFDGTPIDTRMKNMLSESVEKLNKDDFSKLKEKNAAAYSEVLKKRNATEEALKNPKTYEDFVRKKNVMGLSEEETAQYEKMFAEGRKKYREQKKTAKTNDVGEAKAFFSDDSKYTVEKTTHTKTGEDIWVVKPKERIDTESWKQLNEQMKAMGGSYWRGNQGWNFKNDPTASLAGLSEEAGVKSSMPSAERLRKIADGMQKSIDDKFKDRLTNTAKRAREAANAEAEGDRLKMIQSTINNIADVIESGENTLLDKIDSKAQVETLVKMLDVSRRNKISETMPGITYNERLEEQDKPYSNDDIKYAEYPLSRLHENILNEYINSADGKTGYKQIVQRLTKVLKTAENHYVKIDRQSFSDIDKIVKNLQSTRADYWNDEVSERKRLARMGIENAVELRAYLREFINYLPGQDAEAKKQQSIKIRERELANSKIEGFFPTPKPIVEQMLDEADIKPGEKVLEPSAGKGNIADEIKSKFPNNALDVVEWNTSLSELLSDKGHNVVGNDFLKTDSKYDKIIMNPPFEKMQDIDHVKHAYDLLNPGGRVVAIMSESPFFNSSKKAAEFREWLEGTGGTSEKLPENSFKNSERSTGVNTRLVVIDKTEGGDVPQKKKPIVRSSRDVDTSTADYSYKTLTGKSDMTVTLINGENIRTSDGKIDRRSAIEKGLENVRRKNNPKNNSGNAYVYVSDAKSNILVGKRGLSHGLSRNAEATAIVTSKIGDILENSIIVNELAPRENTIGGYVLLGIAVDNNGNYYPVRTVVNKYRDVEEVESLDVLYAVNAKKKSQFSNETELPANAVPPIKGSSKISIAELLNLVKDNFSDVLTDDVLKQVGAERKNSSLSDSIKYSTNSDFDSSRWMTERAGPAEEKKKKPNNKQENVTLSDIIKDISDKFNIPITTGKVTDKAASGIYKETPEVIRTRIANNLPTISHELGHHLDKKYNLSNLKSIDKLKEAIPEDFLKNYSKEEQSGEAVAEFVRTYLKNVNEANKLCSDFYSDFISALSKTEANADFKALNNIASMANEYLSYDIAQRYSTVITSSNKKEKLPFSERWHKFYENWVDKFHSQKRVVDYVETASGKTLSGEKNAYILATNSLNAHTIANFLICEGFRDLKGNIISAKSFIECIGKVNSKDVKVFDEYLMLRHSLEWIAPTEPDVTKKRVFADDTLEDVDKIKTQIADLEKAHPEFKDAAENLYEYQYNLLKYFVVQGGGMTEQTLEDLRRKYPSYVPFYRAVGKSGWFAKSPFANQTTPISKAKGSSEDIISPTESIMRNTEKMVKFALRNQVMQVFASYADNIDGFGQFMEEVPPDMIPHFVDISGTKAKFEDALQTVVNSSKDYFAISDLFNEMFGDEVTDFTPIANKNKRIVTVMFNGKHKYYQIHNEAFYKSVAELSPKQAEGILKISQMIMQPMKLLITQNNPVFAVTNAIRDYGTAYKLSEINNPVVFTQKYIQALGSIISNSDAYKQYKAMGGGHSSELSANIENISKTLRGVAQKDMGKARRLAYSVFRHPVETVASLNDVIESTPRFMEFRRTLEHGGDLQKAIYNADDLTTNFKKSGGGATAKAMNKLIMFNNAAIQGVDKLYRTIADKDVKRRNKKFLKWVLHALIMGVIGYVYNKSVDEEGYKNLSSYKKNNFYNFAIGDGKFISLPKPRENALLDTFTERTIEYLATENKDAFYSFGDYVTSQLLPPMLPDTLNPVDALHQVGGSTVLGGLIDVGFNKDFKDSPIESEYDKYLPSNERYNENTSKAAYWLGQTSIARNADMSPKKIDHLISSYTGILGQANKALFPTSKERVDYSIGLRNKFISDSNYSTDVLNKLYENRDIAEREYKYKSTADNAVEYEQNAIVTAYISEVNKMIKAMPAEQQRNGRAFLLRSLNAWNYNETASQSKIVSRFKNEDVTKNCIITNVPKSTIEWTKNKVKYSYQLTPQQYNAYIKDYLTLIENYRSVQFKKYKNKADCMAALEDTSKEVKKVLNKKYQKKYSGKAKKVKAE